VPQGQQCPYVVLQSPTENRDDRFGVSGKQLTLQAHVYTSSEQVEGSGQAHAIASKLTELMDAEYMTPTVNVSGWDIRMRPEDTFDAGDLMQPGGAIYQHYVLTIRVWAQPVAA
jgi:hypothetical protein